MKNLFFGIGLVCLSTLGFTQNGLEALIVEKYYVSDADDAAESIGTLPVGSVTYRLYADLLPDYKLQAVFGNPTHELKIATTTSFFNNEDRGATNPNGIAANRLKENSVALDSWLSVGASCAGNMGVLKTEDNGVANLIVANSVLKNNDPLAGIPLTTQDGMITATIPAFTAVGISTEISVFDATSQDGNLFTTLSGGWSCLNGATGPTSTNRVLIAQITTDGKLSFELNIQIGTPSGDVQQFVAKDATGDEILFPELLFESNDLPVVTITKPITSSKVLVDTDVDIEATATDEGSVAKVIFYVNGDSIATDETAPFTALYTANNVGKDTIVAIAIDDKGALSLGDTVFLTIDSATNINQVDALSHSIQVYPNPANTKLFADLESTELTNTSYKVFSFEGKLVKESVVINLNASTAVFDISELPQGFYMLEVNTNGSIATSKFIKE